MAYDRYDTRNAPRDENDRWSDDRNRYRNRAYGRGGDDRGFFERAGDEVASWFGDEDAERRRREDRMRDERERGWSGRSRDYGRGYGRDRDRDRNWYETRGLNERGGWSEDDYNPSWRRELERRDRDRRERGYRPVTGDYGRGSDFESEQFFAASGYGRGERGFGDYDRSQSPYGRDQYRRTSYAGSLESEFDPHYRSWRERHMSDLDRDYDDYRRENQSRFENDFGSWRERRMNKRGMLGQIREHMEVVGSDDQHVGTVDRVAGDRIVLTRSDPESGGVHHSLSCSDIDRVEGDKVILDCTADEAHRRWRDESRSRALFEREDQGEMGPRNLNQSFEGTYR
ncbi:MAG TPA: DUF2171 domain-containing protein [Sphingomicrobium sp.]|nr:DUF2171 domain-containing protein [Sphingomicrobium sp.]